MRRNSRVSPLGSTGGVMTAKYLVIAFLLVACGSNKTASDAPGSGDGNPIDSPVSNDAANDGRSTVDAAVGVTCGMTTCTGTQECCVENGMRSCVDAGKCMGVGFVCDGPEDCPTTEVCCLAATGGMPGSTCKPANMCQTSACHEDIDCSGNTPKCCPVGMTGYKICLVHCPVM